ncbi:hypothetical protein Mro03_46470 [Microbispora rosea subsp. rosea]|nr:hypothetical protein Mro03_46470 [Microbispora rosea subsp. rosea]
MADALRRLSACGAAPAAKQDRQAGRPGTAAQDDCPARAAQRYDTPRLTGRAAGYG